MRAEGQEHAPAASSGRVKFVAMQGEPTEWGVAAGLIIRILAEREWHGVPPIDLQALGLCGGSTRATDRILLVRTPAGEVALRALGAVRLRECDASLVYALPPALVDTTHRGVVREVVLDEAPPLLVLDPSALASMAGSAGMVHSTGHLSSTAGFAQPR
jgi:hypothetical protein